MTVDDRRESEDTQWTVNTHGKFNFVKSNFFCRNALQVAVWFLKRECRCRFLFFLCRCRNFARTACRSSQFHLLHVAVSEPCRLSEFTLSGPLLCFREIINSEERYLVQGWGKFDVFQLKSLSFDIKSTSRFYDKSMQATECLATSQIPAAYEIHMEDRNHGLAWTKPNNGIHNTQHSLQPGGGRVLPYMG